MISILIPVFQYEITTLVATLHAQALALNIDFEIICFDDGSKIQAIVNQNEKINALSNCRYVLNSENIGRTAARNALAQMAKFENLLFLDADVLPVNEDFLAFYLNALNQPFDLIVGGLLYRKEDIKQEVSLRWHYGNQRETKAASERQKKPYQHVLSCNFLVKKDFFLQLSLPTTHLYGMDNYFSYLLFKKNAKVNHLENPVFHLGLENNKLFLEKSLEAVQNRKKWMETTSDFETISPLILSYKKIKKYRMEAVVRVLFNCFSPILEKQCMKKQPNLLAFDLYRLGYLCKIANK
ncbi:MAG: glycosyltransferase family 2 protein [Flavobacterium sp.]